MKDDLNKWQVLEVLKYSLNYSFYFLDNFSRNTRNNDIFGNILCNNRTTADDRTITYFSMRIDCDARTYDTISTYLSPSPNIKA